MGLLIPEYHAHVYYSSETKGVATALRQKLLDKQPANRFRFGVRFRTAQPSHVQVGNMHDVPIGPHTQPMFAITIPEKSLSYMLSFLIQERGSLSILIHPVSDNELADHTTNVMFLGTPVPVDITKL